jgi:hypothetical protein
LNAARRGPSIAPPTYTEHQVNDPNPYQPGNAPLANTQQSEASQWRWRYSRWTGIMYGPIPVGIIAVAIGYFIYYSSR